jgi:predicted nucleic-acid-binding protein
MIVVDTNILVRYAVKDDPEQARIATEFLETNECLISRTVILELAWVLTGAYKLPRENVLERIWHILRLPTVSLEDMDNVLLALNWHEAGMDFADALHLSGSLGKQGFATFDKSCANTAKRLAIQQTILRLATT